MDLPDHGEGRPDEYWYGADPTLFLPGNDSDSSEIVPEELLLYQNQLADPKVAAMYDTQMNESFE